MSKKGASKEKSLTVTASRGRGKHLFALVTIFVISLQFVFPVGFSTATTSPMLRASLTEWTVPTPSGGPWALTLDQEGRCCWFLEYYGNRVGHLDPLTGTFQEWAIPTSNAYPYDLAISTVSGSAVLWGTEFGVDNVFAFWPGTGVFRSRDVIVKGTANTLNAALRVGVKRFVHISTAEVYGKVSGEIDETCPCTSMQNKYADAKIEAEKFAGNTSQKGYLSLY